MTHETADTADTTRTPDAVATAAAGPSGPLGGYRELMGVPGAGRLAAASLVSKLPINMFSISVLLLVSPRYSYGAAGLTISAMLIANALTSPLRGRLADRHPVRPVLLGCLVCYLGGLAGLVASASARLPFAAVAGSAAVLGASFPPVTIMLRTYWRAVPGERTRASAYSLESAAMDLTLITGPALAGWLSTGLSPVLPLVLSGSLMTVAVLLMVTLRRPAARGAGDGARDWLGPLRPVALRKVFTAHVLFCAALAAVEVVLPIYAQKHHATGYSGVYLAGLSVGSILGALCLGAASAELRRRVQLPVLLGAFALGCCLLALAMHSSPSLVLLVCPLTGAAIGSTFAALFTTAGRLTPAGYDSEANGWMTSITQVGFAVGASSSAALAAGHGSSFFLVVTAPAIALAVPFLRGATD
ncbi:MFS transporter [Streptantibioticus rubrisoli]|uniref:MFS transporter n=1 Tax=Streptantibioticus rubrisoli TaxID=1387313 RepID=A0ABT1P7Z9_9ACTN|nr:MFS transporter [Streptantibioticus rubrisoli]MCQ4040518.1 MFS transporter [Streptantibioticus rubrisoli]